MEKELAKRFAEELKRSNPEAHLSAQERMDLAFERALRMTTPSHAGCPYEDPSHPKNHNKIYSDGLDTNKGWI